MKNTLTEICRQDIIKVKWNANIQPVSKKKKDARQLLKIYSTGSAEDIQLFKKEISRTVCTAETWCLYSS